MRWGVCLLVINVAGVVSFLLVCVVMRHWLFVNAFDFLCRRFAGELNGALLCSSAGTSLLLEFVLCFSGALFLLYCWDLALQVLRFAAALPF
ncbi:hypothetical protein C2G38_2202005 [Gigaspora rosea]|uniref:Uncharacterized protein n=1 Tax=Gigaspora rosea TaxID=44941 RepID=A0A397UP85_9GLOM|nr:hypothetical protein C2G38_2202005 [Gigaspora rosea]